MHVLNQHLNLKIDCNGLADAIDTLRMNIASLWSGRKRNVENSLVPVFLSLFVFVFCFVVPQTSLLDPVKVTICKNDGKAREE